MYKVGDEVVLKDDPTKIGRVSVRCNDMLIVDFYDESSGMWTLTTQSIEDVRRSKNQTILRRFDIKNLT